MAIQTSVALDPSVAIEGMVSRYHNVDTQDRVTEVGVNNGFCVCMGANERTCKLPTSAADVAKALGVAPYRATQTPGFATHYVAGETIGAVRKGRIWVKVEEAVAQGDPAFVRYASGAGGTALGGFRKSADTSTAAQLGASIYLTAAGIGGLALLEVNLP